MVSYCGWISNKLADFPELICHKLFLLFERTLIHLHLYNHKFLPINCEFLIVYWSHRFYTNFLFLYSQLISITQETVTLFRPIFLSVNILDVVGWSIDSLASSNSTLNRVRPFILIRKIQNEIVGCGILSGARRKVFSNQRKSHFAPVLRQCCIGRICNVVVLTSVVNTS